MNSAELHGTDRDPGYVCERAYELSGRGLRLPTERDVCDLIIELDWEFGPVKVDTSDGLRVLFENNCVSVDRLDKLDAFIEEYMKMHWSLSVEPSEV